MNLREKLKGRREISEADIISAHDVLMTEYGWIPLEEFRNLPIPTFFNLLNQIKKRKEAEANAMKKARRK